MGGGSWTSTDWDSFKSSATHTPSGAKKAAEDIFAESIHPDFDPLHIDVRESCDSSDHPSATPVVVALDVTGSMRKIPHELITDSLGNMVKDILDRKPVPDPQIMFMAVGDSKCDRAPLQATQFESDIRIAEQLKLLYLEGNGGGNGGESYHLPWYLLARKTSLDCFNKRGEKGILFTIGDENIHEVLTTREIKRVFGDAVESDIGSRELLQMVEERFDVFHLQILESGCDNTYDGATRWKELLGERVIPVTDYREIPAIIVSTLEIISGKPKHDVVASWSGSTALVVREAVRDLKPARTVSGLVKDGRAKSVWRPGLGSK